MADLSPDDLRRRHWWILAIALMLIYLLVRVPGLMTLPIFGDESIYLRWAQFARRGDLFRSVIDPKPPLHFWMIASCLGFSEDPLKVSRGLSVLAGMLTIPAVMALCGQLERLVREPVIGFARRDAYRNEPIPPTGQSLGLVAAVLMIFCPFLAFYQRLGIADAWVVLESVVILWLGLKLSGSIWEAAPIAGAEVRTESEKETQRRGGTRLWGITVGLGVAMGSALMTRQIVSYLFPVIVCLGFPLLREGGKLWLRPTIRFVAHMAAAGLIAMILWIPFWVGLPAGYHEGREPAAPVTASSVRSEIRQRFLYQTNFSEPMTHSDRMKRAALNFKMVFVPSGKIGNGDYATGWLWVYLTPGVLLASVVAAIGLAVRTQWRLLGFLGGWFLALMGPLIVFGDVAYSRYALVGVPPLLIVVAYGLMDGLGWLAQQVRMPAVTWATGLVLAGATLIVPVRDIAAQSAKWWEQPLVERDRYQYVTGWTGGLGSRLAIKYITERAKEEPVVVLTLKNEWGNPSDALWAYLQGKPNITMYAVEHVGKGWTLRPAAADKYWLCPDKWSYRPEEPVALPGDATVILALNHPLHTRDGDVPAYKLFEKEDPPVDMRVFPFGKLQTHGGEGEQVLLILLGTTKEIAANLEGNRP